MCLYFTLLFCILFSPIHTTQKEIPPISCSFPDNDKEIKEKHTLLETLLTQGDIIPLTTTEFKTIMRLLQYFSHENKTSWQLFKTVNPLRIIIIHQQKIYSILICTKNLDIADQI